MLALGSLGCGSIGTACGETAVFPDEKSGGSQSGSHSSSAPNDSKKAQHAALTDQKVSKKAQNASPSVSALDEMSVFSRPRTEEDVLPSSLDYLLKGRQCNDWLRSQDRCPGDAKPEESRLLLTNLGVKKTSLYAWPTTNAWVCWAMADGGGGCLRDFRPRGAARGRRTWVSIRTTTEWEIRAHSWAWFRMTCQQSRSRSGGSTSSSRQSLRTMASSTSLPKVRCSFWAFQSLTTDVERRHL